MLPSSAKAAAVFLLLSVVGCAAPEADDASAGAAVSAAPPAASTATWQQSVDALVMYKTQRVRESSEWLDAEITKTIATATRKKLLQAFADAEQATDADDRKHEYTQLYRYRDGDETLYVQKMYFTLYSNARVATQWQVRIYSARAELLVSGSITTDSGREIWSHPAKGTICAVEAAQASCRNEAGDASASLLDGLAME